MKEKGKGGAQLTKEADKSVAGEQIYRANV